MTLFVDLVVRVLVNVLVPLLWLFWGHGVYGHHDGVGGFGDIDEYVFLFVLGWRWCLCGGWGGGWLLIDLLHGSAIVTCWWR